jgi:hypothetical protein
MKKQKSSKKKKNKSRKNRKNSTSIRSNPIEVAYDRFFGVGHLRKEQPQKEEPQKEETEQAKRPYRFRTFAMCNMLVMIHGEAIDDRKGDGVEVTRTLFVETHDWDMSKFEQFLIQIQWSIEGRHKIEWDDHQLYGSILPSKISISGVVEGKKKRVFMDE